MEGDTITRQNQVIETKKNVRFQNNASASTRKFHHAGSASNGKYFFYNSKGSSCHQQFRTGSTNKDCNSRACASNNMKIIYKKHSKCTISRKTSLLHGSLGKNYSGSRNIIYCKGVRNPVCKSSISGENTKLDKNVKRTVFISGTGSFGNVGEKSYPKSSTHTKAISEQPLPCRKKGWREPPSDKLKKSQQIHSLRAFQNGKSALSGIPSGTGQFAMQGRSQGGIFFSSPQQKLSKACKISMVRQPIPISLPMFWTRTSSNNFYRIIKSLSCSLETGQHSNNYLPRRYVANGEDVTRYSHGKRHVDFSIATFRFCDQPQKVSSAPCETNRVSGLGNRYRENEFRSFREKIKACVSTMSGDFQATKNFSLNSHKVNWPVIINCPGHFTSSSPVSISSTGANISSTEKRFLQWSCDTGEFSKRGTPLVDGKLKTLQWEENSATRTPYDHSDRCLSKRLGHINALELLALKFAILTFHKEFVTLDHSCSNRQQTCSGISFEDGWYPQSTASKNQQVNLELSAISSDHNYCRVPFKQVECQSRLGVQECNILFRLETSSESLSENNQTLRNSDSRSICLQAVSSTSPIYDMEARSKQMQCSRTGIKCLVLHSHPSA